MLRMTDSLLLLFMYVDDLLIIDFSTSVIYAVKRILHDRFLMTYMDPLHFFLGLEISRDALGIKLSQAKYARDLLERFHMKDYKSSSTPFLSGVKLEDGGESPLVDSILYRQLVERFLYLTHSIPYISYEFDIVSRFMQEPHELHWKVAKCILRYIQGTITFGIHYETNSTFDLIGFTDFDWDGDNTNRKSTSSYLFSLGSKSICWLRKN
jgi:hypothetical protein